MSKTVALTTKYIWPFFKIHARIRERASHHLWFFLLFIIVILVDNLDGDAGVGVNQLAVVGLGVGVPQMGPSLKEPGREFPSGVIRAPSGSPGQGGGSVGGAGIVDLHVFVGVGAGVAENTGVHLDVTRTFAVTSETQNLTSLSEALLSL